MKREVLLAATWQALAYAAAKEGRRDLLKPAAHAVDLKIDASIGTDRARLTLAGELSIGEEQTVAGSEAPTAVALLALVLSLLGKRTRDLLVADLPEQFDRAGGQLPEVAEEMTAAAKSLVKRLNVKTAKPRRGAVSYAYSLASLK